MDSTILENVDIKFEQVEQEQQETEKTGHETVNTESDSNINNAVTTKDKQNIRNGYVEEIEVSEFVEGSNNEQSYLPSDHDKTVSEVSENVNQESSEDKEVVKFIISERGGRKLVRNGYFYVHKRNLAGGCSSWECVLRRKNKQCKAKIKLSSRDEFLEETVDGHTHPPLSSKAYEEARTSPPKAKTRTVVKNEKEFPLTMIKAKDILVKDMNTAATEEDPLDNDKVMFIKTERGTRKLVKNGYSYVHRRKLAGGYSSWECVLRRKSNQCKAKIKLSPLGEFISESEDGHTHSPTQTKYITKVPKFIAKIVEQPNKEEKVNDNCVFKEGVEPQDNVLNENAERQEEEENRITFLTTQRGRKIRRNGYTYVHRRKLAEGCSTWVCILRNKEECKAKIKISSLGDIVDEKQDKHTHLPSEKESLVSTGSKRKVEKEEEEVEEEEEETEVEMDEITTEEVIEEDEEPVNNETEKTLESYVESPNIVIPSLESAHDAFE